MLSSHVAFYNPLNSNCIYHDILISGISLNTRKGGCFPPLPVPDFIFFFPHRTTVNYHSMRFLPLTSSGEERFLLPQQWNYLSWPRCVHAVFPSHFLSFHTFAALFGLPSPFHSCPLVEWFGGKPSGNSIFVFSSYIFEELFFLADYPCHSVDPTDLAPLPYITRVILDRWNPGGIFSPFSTSSRSTAFMISLWDPTIFFFR